MTLLLSSIFKTWELSSRHLVTQPVTTRILGTIGILQFSELKEGHLTLSIPELLRRAAEEKLSLRAGGHSDPTIAVLINRALILVPGPPALLGSPM